jgi:DNA modification methylase
MKTIEKYLNSIICGDCLDAMKEMPSNSVDLIVTSPPYNLKNSTGNGMKSKMDIVIMMVICHMINMYFTYRRIAKWN